MSAAPARTHRDTIFLEAARVVRHDAFAADQYILRVAAPECARRAVAGSFAHIQCADGIPMRRPLSIMRVDRARGEVDFLYKIVGMGLAALSKAAVGDMLSILGPIGNGFTPHADKPVKLMIGGGVGIPPMVFLAEQLHLSGADLHESLVLMGSEVPFPFQVVSSGITAADIPEAVSAGMPDLEALGVASRLASLQGYAGCYKGDVTELARLGQQARDAARVPRIELFA